MKKIISLSILCLIFLAACASKSFIEKEQSLVTKEGIASLYVKWFKDKKNKFDVSFFIENHSSTPLLINSSMFICGKGDVQGTVHKVSSEAMGEGIWPVKSKEVTNFLLLCRLPKKEIEGKFYIKIEKIFSNPKEDFATMGEIVATNMKLEF